MYTIKQAASRSGVSVPLLRAWERRYGIVEPARTASRYRLYDDASIDRLRAMRLLIEDGWSASAAAAHLRAADEDQVQAVLRTSPVDGVPASSGPRRDGRDGLVGEFVATASALDEPGFEAVLDEMFARASFEQAATDLVMPALVALGEGWERGRLDVAAEHAAASAVSRRLGAAFLAAGRPSAGTDLVLVGLPPGARHELGALAFATAARRAGLRIRYLGADLPVRDWVDVAVHTSAAGAVVGAIMAADAEPAERVAAALLEARPEMLVAFGGHAAAAVQLTDARRSLRLSDDLGAAVDELRVGLARTKAGRQ